ncbi:dTDP-4-amino-4,6-dideoxygalactose transaminase [Catenovulum sediminis]|uniref:dTDP-4-amino-4,6-dideoxygalactose transaminase n=1 Tax=Catenovulum sediminis TaxID=1740262 RepID=UPI00163D556C|nr:dTDP-4-amino-4,6-dideoxygalactose transaminase [Catenovulum sediminis]
MDTIKFNEPFLAGNELEYIQDVFAQKHFYGNGKYTKLCTEFIKAQLNVENVLITDSCTSALEITALLLRDTGKEQEIILPSYTFSSTASAFARAGFKLIFAEVNPKTMMLDVDDVKSKINANTTAVVVVHYGGYCADIYDFRDICDEKDIYLVEDAAQAFNCFIGGKALGSIGDFGCFSFHETKNIHAGLSGALLVKDNNVIDRATYIWERGTNRQDVLKGIANKYSWVEIGGSFYPTELQTAFLYAQLEAVEQNLAERKVIYDEYNAGLTPLKDADILHYPDFQDDYKSNYHAFFVVFNSEVDADKVRELLKENNVHAYIGYIPLHSSPVGLKMGYSADTLPVTEEYAKRVLRLPFHNQLTLTQVSEIIKLIKGCF